ncbi:Metal-dependent hydrolase, beta-lactamase superfamily II [Pseudobutyrivibrio sp. YE44]|uniref:ComEC/Rec2 family competence protein n=1 Tax=Pseudobutyrivibrio sp. YE44 TaxID=1520802 RepID=UPI000883C249|nr:MBL fold metallo-hydrolase [Pseudobutyrivibrio sp. YE44]SDB38604.1 Metal-dependent hydrolase, beta-lactamase superfamily II [Pseudobutyrivibrio sp. YE44]
MVWLNFIKDMTQQYWGDFGYVTLFLLALVTIFFIKRDSLKRGVILLYTTVVLIFIYNPITYFVCRSFMEETTFIQYYQRFFSVLPVFVIIAFGATLLVDKLKGFKKLIAVIGCLALLVVLGDALYKEEWFTKAENRNKVPQDVVTICDVFADYEGDVIRIMAPQDIAVYLRQMDSRFSMPYSRYIPDEAYHLTNAVPDPQVIVDYAKENDVDFVVVSAVDTTLNTYLNYGFKLFGRTPYYAVLQPNDPTWIVTEYADASGDQGLAWTAKNMNDGTFIVIDGGNAGNEQQMREAIKENGGTVDAWILTHYHKDHIDTFNAIYEDPKGIKIKDIYVTPLAPDTFYGLNLQEWDDVDTYKKFMEITEGADNIHELSRDQKLSFGKAQDLKLTCFNVGDDVVLNNPEDIPNNVSLVFKLETEQRSALICADAHSKYLADYLVETYGDKLDADILQCGHHGNNSMPVESGFYKMVSPEIAVFDAPDWLMTGPEYTAGQLADYLQKLGARVVWFNTAPNVFGF